MSYNEKLHEHFKQLVDKFCDYLDEKKVNKSGYLLDYVNDFCRGDKSEFNKKYLTHALTFRQSQLSLVQFCLNYKIRKPTLQRLITPLTSVGIISSSYKYRMSGVTKRKRTEFIKDKIVEEYLHREENGKTLEMIMQEYKVSESGIREYVKKYRVRCEESAAKILKQMKH